MFFNNQSDFFEYIKLHGKKNLILIGGDNNILEESLVAIYGLINKTPKMLFDDTDVLLLSSDIDNITAQVLTSIFNDIHILDIKSTGAYMCIEPLLNDTAWGAGLYSKYYTFELAIYYQKVVYLDYDVFIKNSFYGSLLNFVSDRTFDMAVCTYQNSINLFWMYTLNQSFNQLCHFNDTNHIYSNKIEFISDDIINSGVFVVDQKIIQKIKDISEFYKNLKRLIIHLVNTSVSLNDESILSFILKAYAIDIIVLPDDFNYIPTLNYINEPQNIHLIHFASDKLRLANKISLYRYDIEDIVYVLVDRINHIQNVVNYSICESLKNKLLSFITLSKDSVLERYNMMRLYNFFKNSFVIFTNVLGKTKILYAENILNDRNILLFCKKARKTTRLQIMPRSFKTNSAVLLKFRISLFNLYIDHADLLMSDEFKKFLNDFKKSFNNSKLVDNKNDISLYVEVEICDLEETLYKLDSILLDNENLLYMI